MTKTPISKTTIKKPTSEKAVKAKAAPKTAATPKKVTATKSPANVKTAKVKKVSVHAAVPAPASAVQSHGEPPRSSIDIKIQIAQLQSDLVKIEKAEKSRAHEQIRSIMLSHGITSVAGVKLGKGGKKAAADGVSIKAPSIPKYRDDKGNVWSGRGRQPLWIIGKNKEDFLIK